MNDDNAAKDFHIHLVINLNILHNYVNGSIKLFSDFSQNFYFSKILINPFFYIYLKNSY